MYRNISIDHSTPAICVQEADSYVIPKMGDRKIYRRMPTDSDCQTITALSGERFYVR